ncbi:sugar nucleotide-binding protein [Carboxylicivirga marina]|uniref:dTDP-4-dehydrorhamnose reductase n=1 Tax=Carboxylicivirga marina TaxID=2800988 RepID=A0ABS1HJ39_9BACT|nr:sugar nucleotide-binding protein [Carboxylicivirga marina]MBK3517677.1 sugar nucleotide-binding protein [Carboxylicivirga marina]
MRKRPIIILGHKGMLGQMAVKFFSGKGYNVITISQRFEPESRLEFFNEIKNYPDAIIINAIGKIKQKTEDTSPLLWSNAILPLELSRSLLPTQTLLHASTDCLFSGDTDHPYKVNAHQDAIDDYGWSKQLGEHTLLNRPNTLIARVSIIGTDNAETPKGLLGWFLSQPNNASLKGFTNHLWNGITTLEWCKQIELIIDQLHVNTPCQLIQFGTEDFYSKYDLLKLFQEVFNTNFSIEPFETPQKVDRRLKPQIIVQNLNYQLCELKAFSEND